MCDSCGNKNCSGCGEVIYQEEIPVVISAVPSKAGKSCGVPVTPGCCNPVVGQCIGKLNGCGCASCCQVNVPYYQQVQVCPENNREIIVETDYKTVFKALQNFAMPGCGQSVTVVFDVPTDVPLGAWLWSQGVGYLTIMGYNPYTKELLLNNECPSNCNGQASPGTPISTCSLWVLSTPQCSSSSGGPSNLYPYLAADFTAPAVEACINITVTNVNGLAVGKDVTIAGGIYRIGAIIDATTIQICNDGAGVTPNTVVYAKDSSGNLDVPIVLIDSNQCSNPVVEEGSVLVCNAGVTQPLTGTQVGQILTLDDTVTGSASYKTLNIEPLNCSPLAFDLTLSPSNPPDYEYAVQVSDASGFTVGQTITITFDSVEYIFEIQGITSNVLSSTLISPSLSGIINISAGTNVCEQTCCADLQIQVDQLDTRVTAIEEIIIDNPMSVTDVDTTVDANPITIVGGSGTYISRAGSAITGFNITNPNPNRDMIIMAFIKVFGELDISDGVDVKILLEMQIDGGGWTEIGSYRLGMLDPDTHILNSSCIIHTSDFLTVAAGATVVVDLRSRLYVVANPTNNSTWNNDSISIQTLGVLK